MRRLYDRFEEEEIEMLPNGDFMVHFHVSMDDWGYGVLLGFGPSAEVLAPEPRVFLEKQLHRLHGAAAHLSVLSIIVKLHQTPR